jgi:hypothetical protein
MTRGQSGQAPEPWRPFEQVARAYETWYETRRGQRADQAEHVLLEWLVGQSPGAETLLEVGCGTGHFAAGLERRHQRVVGLDRPCLTSRARGPRAQSMEPRGSLPPLGAGATRRNPCPRARHDHPVSTRAGQNRHRAPLDWPALGEHALPGRSLGVEEPGPTGRHHRDRRAARDTRSPHDRLTRRAT